MGNDWGHDDKKKEASNFDICRCFVNLFYIINYTKTLTIDFKIKAQNNLMYRKKLFILKNKFFDYSVHVVFLKSLCFAVACLQPQTFQLTFFGFCFLGLCLHRQQIY